jgi:hypothetical protein
MIQVAGAVASHLTASGLIHHCRSRFIMAADARRTGLPLSFGTKRTAAEGHACRFVGRHFAAVSTEDQSKIGTR